MVGLVFLDAVGLWTGVIPWLVSWLEVNPETVAVVSVKKLNDE